ncbi:MAG: PD-(D/E)XK nuclease family protein, partial [Armatimonadaceae bacterium]
MSSFILSPGVQRATLTKGKFRLHNRESRLLLTVRSDGSCIRNEEILVPKPSTRKFQLSPTKIRTFRDCPAKYRWEYIEKLGRFYRRPKPYYSFGTSIHSTLDA